MKISKISNHHFIPAADLVAAFEQWAKMRTDDIALTVLSAQNDQLIEKRYTYGELWERIRAVAAVLQKKLPKGERLLLLLDNDEYYLIAMLGCFAAGMVAVPVFPPDQEQAQNFARLMNIAEDAQAKAVLTVSAFRHAVEGFMQQVGISQVIDLDLLDLHESRAWVPHYPSPYDIAFLQYTSGSTSETKGVMVAHTCLMANEFVIREEQTITQQDSFAVWSPLSHDMGLIGALLQSVYSGIHCVLSSPQYFIEQPLRWLQMISKYRVTISGGPDFAYRLCLERIDLEQCKDLDLSCWRIAYTGAEPVRHDTMERFVERYAPFGFDARSICPCYGLAEATLYVAGNRRGNGLIKLGFSQEALVNRQVVLQEGGLALVGCGSTAIHHEIAIVDPESRLVLAENQVGEIWVAGSSITPGYWNKPKESNETFVRLNGKRWLRTGDLGFFYDGQLFIAGRLKEMIIVRGQNIYPQDIELGIEEEVEAVSKGRVLAFSVEAEGVEGIGIAAEVSQGLQKLIPTKALVDAISIVVSKQCGEAPKVIALMNPDGIPKTASGKLQRMACRQRYQDHSLDAYAVFVNDRFVLGGDINDSGASVENRDALTQSLENIWRIVLNHEQSQSYENNANFFALGGNSLAATQLVVQIKKHWGIDFSLQKIFQHPCLNEMAQCIRGSQAESLQQAMISVVDKRNQPFPLSFAQKRQWFIWQLDQQSTAYHIQGALLIKGDVDAKAMDLAIKELGKRHESLRTVFRVGANSEPEQLVQENTEIALQVIDLSQYGMDEAYVQESIHELCTQPFDLTRGPLARFALISLVNHQSILIMVMHHIISDGVSMQILIDELGLLYAYARAAEPKALNQPKLQYIDYAVWQNKYPEIAMPAKQLAYWQRQLGTEHPVIALPIDYPHKASTRRDAGVHYLEVPQNILSRLRNHL